LLDLGYTGGAANEYDLVQELETTTRVTSGVYAPHQYPPS
jgi:hypothetical protein